MIFFDRCITHTGRHREPNVKTLHSPVFAEALYVEWRNSTHCFASTPEQRNIDINLNKYFISSSGDRTHYRPVTITSLCPCATTAIL